MPTEWSKILLEIRRKRMSMPALAANLNEQGVKVSAKALYALLNGATLEPRDSLARGIREWHRKLTTAL